MRSRGSRLSAASPFAALLAAFATVATGDHWDRASGVGLSSQEWDPSPFGCSLSIGSSIQPLLQIQKVNVGSVYWQPAIDCGGGLTNLPKTLTTSANTAYALGESEIYGYQTSSSPLVIVWSSMTDSHISNLFISPGLSSLQAWGNYACFISDGTPPWHPVQAYGGYSFISGGSSCNNNLF